jgi:hypothetical protein
MVAIIERKNDAAGAAFIELSVYRSPTNADRILGRRQHADEEPFGGPRLRSHKARPEPRWRSNLNGSSLGRQWCARCGDDPDPGGGAGVARHHTDMRRGMNGLALQVQERLKRDPHAGDPYVFQGKSGRLIKVLWQDGIGMSLSKASICAVRAIRSDRSGRDRLAAFSASHRH